MVCCIVCIGELTGHAIARHPMKRIISIGGINAILTQESRKLITLAIFYLNVIKIIRGLYIIR